jgi:hypothetical protein
LLGQLVSAEGLILTNHHCVVECAQNLSSDKEDLVANGFVAARREDERSAWPAGRSRHRHPRRDRRGERRDRQPCGRGAGKARDAKIADIEKAGCTDLATTRCQVVTLFGGGQYKLYTYRKIPTCAWSGRRNSRPRSLAVIPTTSTIPAMPSMPRSCAPMKTASR